MSLYPAVPSAASPAAVPAGWPPEAGGVRVVAVRVCDLRSPVRRPLREGDRTALTAAGAGTIRTGDLVVFLEPVAVAPAVVRRDGRVQAGGHPADHARLGVIEQQLDEMSGRPGTIDEVAAQVTPRGKVKGTARRSMTMAAALRAELLMGLMPDAGYGEILTALFGDLPLVPWHVPFAVPTETVLATWRDAAGPEPVLRLQDLVLAASDAEHYEHDYRAIEIGDLHLGSIDGSVTRMPDTPGNRAEYGSSGTADDSAPYPQLRDLLVSDAFTRATLGIVTGPSGGDKAEAEQALLDRALLEYARVFTKRRLWVLDRNFPGVARLRRLAAVTHVLVRLKSDITITRIGGFLPDGSYLADIGGKDQTIRMRVIEYYVHVDGQDVPEMFCLATDLDDWQHYPAAVLAAAYKWRWDGSETALREAKSAIRGAGPSTGPIFRSHTPDLIRQEHAAWITACELTRAAARAAARSAAPARKGRRAGKPVHPREISFTAARRAAITTTRNGTATASLPGPLTTAGHDAALRDLGRCRVVIDRDRHRDHKTKARQAFPAAGRNITTRKAPATITVCGPIAA
ncbi:MAG: hypothetical protein ACRDP5_05595 [Streptosporangiaceae bacterium]